MSDAVEMHIPHFWKKVTAEAQPPQGRAFPVSAWGWGDDERTAQIGAAERLRRILDRVARGESLPDRYGYGSRPLREEILQTFQSGATGQAVAIITRNGYGAQVLNAANLLFLDIDRPPITFWQRLSQFFGGKAPSSEEAILARLREVLTQYGRATFRVYRTAAGLRVVAVDREFDPAGDEAQELMRITGTDPAFSRLCMVQHSFRARLTPKPWRCKYSVPPVAYPRVDEAAERQFESWILNYEKVAGPYATCHYLETVGDGKPSGVVAQLLEVHDRITHSGESRPLA